MSITNRRETTIRSRFVEYGCSERFELLDIIDSQHVMLRCKDCGNEFTRVTAFLNKSKNHGIECVKCGMHANGKVTPPRSEVKPTIDKKAVIDYYKQGFSISQTAAKFSVNQRRIAGIVDKAGIRRVTDKYAEDEHWADLRRRSKETYYAKAKPKRERTIHERFEAAGCSSHFEIAQITDRTHIVIRCVECGREFKRQTAFLDTGKYTNIGCPECGIHVDGTYAHVQETHKEVDEDALVEFYNLGYSITQTEKKFGINRDRIRSILDSRNIPYKAKLQPASVADEYMHELTGDLFLDEEFICGECGRVFTRHDYMVHESRKNMVFKSLDYCSKKCSNKASSKLKRKVSGVKRGTAYERRLQLRTIPLGDLMERDKGICQICYEPVDLNDVYYNDDGYMICGELYPTVDHKNPKSRGGETTWENVQLAHMGCNTRKHARTMEEYLAATAPSGAA